MRRFLLGGIFTAALMLSGAAAAGEYDWTGGYAGVNAGGAWGKSNAHTSSMLGAGGYFIDSDIPSIASTGSQDIKPDGFTGGVQAGFNQQQGNIVYGIEADFNAFDLNKSASTTTVYPCCAPSTYTITQRVKTDWLASLRPRIGYATQNWLFYATGGLAVTKLKYRESFSDNFATASQSASMSKTKAGWTLGAGAEVALDAGWSLKGEYLYTHFGAASSTSSNLTAGTPTVAFPSNVFSHSADLSTSTLRVGLNYHF